MPFDLKIDASALASPVFSIPGVIGTTTSLAILNLQLEAGEYRLLSPGGSESWRFNVTASGLIDYVDQIGVSNGGFLAGKGTDTLVVAGFQVALDGTGLTNTQYRLDGTTDWLDAQKVQALRLLPGSYRFVLRTGTVPEATFSLDVEGKLDYPVTSDSFLSGRGSSNYTVRGLPLTIDGTGLTNTQYRLDGTTDWLDARRVQALRLLPGSYRFVLRTGTVPEATFSFDVGGKLDYPVTSDSFLSGRGSSNYTVRGLPLTIDGTGLTNTQYRLDGTTDWLDAQKVQALRLMPGSYRFVLRTGTVPEATFSFDVGGKLDYPVTSDSFLSGRGSSNYTVRGLPLTIDGTGLTNTQYRLDGTTDWLDAQKVQALRLLPGSYRFVLRTGTVPEATFSLDVGGKLDYPVMSDSFLSGRGSSNYTVRGLPLTIDGTGLTNTQYRLDGTTDWLDAQKVQALRLLPGSYRFVLRTGTVPEATFSFDVGGKLDYPVTSDSFLSGRGSSNYTVRGLPLTIDGTGLTNTQYRLDGTTDWLDARRVQALRLLPGSYRFVLRTGTVPEATFSLDVEGKLDYPVTSDSFLSGRGSSNYTVRGLPLTIDGTGLTNTQYRLDGTTDWLDAQKVQALRLLPGSYRFVLRTGTVPEATFSFDVGGKLDYPVTSDSFLSGRGSSNYTVRGLPLTIDGTGLTNTQYLVEGTTDWLDAQKVQALRLLPGSYRFVLRTGTVPEATFSFDVGGKLDYPVTSDSFLSGRGSSNYTVRGLPLTIDGTGLTNTQYRLDGTTDWLDAQKVQALRLLPGSYRFVLRTGTVPEATFSFDVGGKLDYPVTSDSFLSGRGSSNYTVRGLPLTIDGTGLTNTQYRLDGTTDWLDARRVQALRLLPGSYRFVLRTGTVPEATFSFDVGGKLDYPVTSDSFLSGRGSSNYTVRGLPLTIDGTGLTNTQYLVEGTTDWLDARQPQALRLLPGRYQLVQRTGVVKDAAFAIDLAGKLDYPAASDTFLSGRGSSSFVLRGLSITIDASAFPGIPVRLLPDRIEIEAGGPGNALRLLPQSALELVVLTTPQLSARFDLLRSSVASFHEQYDFLSVEQRPGGAIIRLESQARRLRDLPAYLRDDPGTQDLLRAFERLLLGGGDDLHSVLNANPPGLESTLDELPRYFTPGTTSEDGAPDEFLPWLGQWVALSLRTDITFGANKSVTRENELRRSFIADLARIYRFRGTKRSMQELLGVFTARREVKDGKLVTTPREVIINDQVDGQPNYFVIQLNLEEIKGASSITDFERVKELADSVIRLEKPAHTRYLLIPAVTTMRIGQRAEPPTIPPNARLPTKDFIRVGDNTRLGVVPKNPKPAWES